MGKAEYYVTVNEVPHDDAAEHNKISINKPGEENTPEKGWGGLSDSRALDMGQDNGAA